jgi:hypothetical protein
MRQRQRRRANPDDKRSRSDHPGDICMRLPDFICVGVQKAGTTWLYEQLCSHPQVFMPKKELDFFFKPLGLAWYGAHFEGAGEPQVCGDIR